LFCKSESLHSEEKGTKIETVLFTKQKRGIGLLRMVLSEHAKKASKKEAIKNQKFIIVRPL